MSENKTEQRGLSGKTRLNYLVDFVTLLLILAMIGTGIVIRYVLPAGSGGHGGGGRWLLWGLGRHDWGGVHFWLAVGLTVVMALHVALHWKWVCGITCRWIGRLRGGGVELGRRTAYGVAFLVLVTALIGGFTWLSWSSVEVVPGEGHGHGRHSRHPPAVAVQEPAEAPEHGHHSDGELVRGSMSLREVADASGIGVGELKALLGIPATVSGYERLGRLKRRFGFEIEDVRKAIAERKRNE